MWRLIELSRCRSFRCLTNLLAFGSVLSIASAFAEQPAGAVAKPAAKPTETRTQAHTESAAIPEWAEKINLTGSSRVRLKRSSATTMPRSVWFGTNSVSATWQAICMESSLMAAIEDNLSEPQRVKYATNAARRPSTRRPWRRQVPK